MRYDQTVQQSAEILRQLLPQLPKHTAAFHPISYAIWYEYCAGINPDLRARVDEIVAAGQTIDDAQAYELYRQFILDAWSARTLSVNTQLEGLVDHFEQSAVRASSDAEDFEQALGHFEQHISDAPAALRAGLTGELLASGSRVRGTVEALRHELQDSVADTRRLREELKRLHAEVLTDPLTGLFNRRGLETAFDEIHRTAVRTGSTCSAILVDVDHFKRFNDTQGHLFGDQVLKTVAGALQRRAREADLVARLGGEEFLIVLPDTKMDRAQQIAEDMRGFVERAELRNRSNGDSVARVTISAGVTGMREQDSPAGMIQRADMAMYRAKNRGRNQVAVLA